MNTTLRRVLFDLSVWGGSLAFALAVWVDAVHAGPTRVAADNPTWRVECGSCHIPYPPALLSVQDWTGMMRTLERHFGTDASIDPKAAAEITTFLERHAGRGELAGARGTPRITTTPWFRREHRKISAVAWSNQAVKSPANCAACHPGAERGDFDEDAVRVPR